MQARIWKPDTYFNNVKDAEVHKVTMPNILLRIDKNGDILYSMRWVGGARLPVFPLAGRRFLSHHILPDYVGFSHGSYRVLVLRSYFAIQVFIGDKWQSSPLFRILFIYLFPLIIRVYVAHEYKE